jgi:hypothetical protein
MSDEGLDLSSPDPGGPHRHPVIFIINQYQTSRSRFLPPTEGPNLGKLYVSLFSRADNFTNALFPHNPSPSSMYIVVVTPRHIVNILYIYIGFAFF